MSTPVEQVTPSLLRGWPLKTDTEGKEDRGSLLIIGGARRTPGAAMLAGLAGMRAGAGRLTLAVAESVAVQVAVAIPESGTVGLPESGGGIVGSAAAGVLDTDLASADAVVIGPGLDDPEQTAALLEAIAPGVGPEASVVLDAYALGVLVDLPDVYKQWEGRLVLTPNTGEALRLLGNPGSGSGEPAAVMAKVARKYSAVVAGSRMVIDPDGHIWEIPAGNPGLGTSGSGDVLAGAVGGLLARGASPSQAACWGMYLHAAAADRLAAGRGPLAFLARELLEEMPSVMNELSR